MQFPLTLSSLLLLAAVASCSTLPNDINLDLSVQTLFPTIIGELDQKLEQISQCYEPELAGFNVDIFDREASIKSIVDKYYQAFPEKTMTQESVGNLIVSINQIANSCLNSEFCTIRYGFTRLSDMSNSQIDAMFGVNYQMPSIESEVGLTGADAACRKTGATIPSNFDWRPQNVVTSVKDQALCGSCWAFATAASIESAYLIQGKTKDINISLSAQQVLDCAKYYGCKGGTSLESFGYVKENGITSSLEYPYEENDNGCDGRKYVPLANITNFCVRSRMNYSTTFHTETLTDDHIVETLLNYGPLYISLNADKRWSKNYRSGVVKGPCTTTPNHAVLLVGYTPNSWIIKNSWGAKWGLAGYFEIARGGNVCGVNTEIAYPLL